MNVKTTDKIDMVVRLPGEPLRCALVACDDADRDARARDAALDRKLKVYLAFVRSGQFSKHFPEFARAKILIKVVCSGTPTPHMTEIEGVHDGRTRLSVEVMTKAEFLSGM